MATHWRLLAIAYAAILTTLTHWPALDLDSAVYPAPDKLLHLVAFAGLAVLLQRAGWFSAPWQLAAVALAWAALDELTQSLPVLRRHGSLQDMAASQMGVVLVATWWWALRAAGGPAARRRHASLVAIFDGLLNEPRTWLVCAAAGTAGAAVALGAAWPLVTPGDPLLPSWLLLAGVLGASAGGVTALAALMRRRHLASNPRGPGVQRRIGVLAAGGALLLIAAGLGMLAADLVAAAGAGRGWPAIDTPLTVGVTVGGVTLAAGVRLYRQRAA